jgi:hypothetical protein
VRLSPQYEADEVVLGLECNFGVFAYSYASGGRHNVSEHPHRSGCHNPIETPAQRHHCDRCGGDYCALHAEPAMHDCQYIVSTR